MRIEVNHHFDPLHVDGQITEVDVLTTLMAKLTVIEQSINDLRSAFSALLTKTTQQLNEQSDSLQSAVDQNK
jgi:hypothetical protein